MRRGGQGGMRREGQRRMRRGGRGKMRRGRPRGGEEGKAEEEVERSEYSTASTAAMRPAPCPKASAPPSAPSTTRAVLTRARRSSAGVRETPCWLRAERTVAATPHAFGDAIDVPWYWALPWRLWRGTGAMAPPGAQSVGKKPSGVGPREVNEYEVPATYARRRWWEIVGGDGRGRVWEIMGDGGRWWEVVGGRGRSWEVMGGECDLLYGEHRVLVAHHGR